MIVPSFICHLTRRHYLDPPSSRTDHHQAAAYAQIVFNDGFNAGTRIPQRARSMRACSPPLTLSFLSSWRWRFRLVTAKLVASSVVNVCYSVPAAPVYTILYWSIHTFWQHTGLGWNSFTFYLPFHFHSPGPLLMTMCDSFGSQSFFLFGKLIFVCLLPWLTRLSLTAFDIDFSSFTHGLLHIGCLFNCWVHIPFLNRVRAHPTHPGHCYIAGNLSK